MKSFLKTVSLLLAAAILLTSCAGRPADTADAVKTPLSVQTAAAAPTLDATPAATPELTPEPTPEPTPVPDTANAAYRDYLGSGADAFLNGNGNGETEAPAETPAAQEEEEPEATARPSGAVDYSRLLAKKNQTYDRTAAELNTLKSDFPWKKDYTLMIYMIGSNLESAQGSATKDIREMLAASPDFSKINVILYTGGSVRWNTDIPCDRNCIVDLSRDPEEWVVASTEKNADMGAPEALTGFVNFTTKNYPADHYGLIFWDHGGGPLFGYGSDELFSGWVYCLQD